MTGLNRVVSALAPAHTELGYSAEHVEATLLLERTQDLELINELLVRGSTRLC